MAGSPRASGSGSPNDLPPRYDGNRDPVFPQTVVQGNARNVDMGGSVYGPMRGAKVVLPPRPLALSKLGKEVKVGLNAFNVVAFPSEKIYQYDILIGSGLEKRGLVKKLWASKGVKDALKGAQGWLFDGSKIAWSMDNIERELRVTVDLDKEQDRKPREGQENKNTHRVIIRRSKQLTFDSLRGFLTKQADWTDACLESVTFLDHLLREAPSQRMIAIKRNFFPPDQKRNPLAPGIEHMFGVYQSIRLSYQPDNPTSTGLTVNVDVANGTFWQGNKLTTVVIQAVGAQGEADFMHKLKNERGDIELDKLRDLKKLHVVARHRNPPDEYVIARFTSRDSKSYTFKARQEDGSEKSMSIWEYFKTKYNFKLQNPGWPLVEMTKKGIVLPIECLELTRNQRYVRKLDDRATASMIKLAVTPPSQRWAAIERGLAMLNWGNDVYMKNFKMKIDAKPITVKGRLLPAPEVTFANGAIKPGTSGRWDVRGKKFLTPNTRPLKAWGVCVLPGRGAPDKNAIEHCINELVKVYTGHGGKVETRSPVLHVASKPDAAKAVEELWNKVGNQYNTRPQILFFILQDRHAMTYGRIKKSCECRYGVVSQCMQMSNVLKAQGQYLSNVCLKLNAKLGGSTARSTSAASKGPYGLFKVPTLVLGVDVSHGAPGTLTQSMAAITASADALCTRYNAACNSNGFRLEQITPNNMTKLIKPLMQIWMSDVNSGRFPSRIVYFRDGVSEGQFDMVVKQEIADLKAMVSSAAKHKIAFTVIVATKRHHVRFFPKDENKDRNGNPLPGTLIETGVTHPREWDFYLNSHAAIKGTARPTHYHVLMNEDGGEGNAALTPDFIHTFAYEHVYQYCRATTPVSLPPAVYYAHLASKRAIFHDETYGAGSQVKKAILEGKNVDAQRAGLPAAKSQTGDGKGEKGDKSSSEPRGDLMERDLMDMPNGGGINSSMWWV